MQHGLARDLEENIESYYNFDSNIVNHNYTQEVNRNYSYYKLRRQQLQWDKLAIYTIPNCNY
jgi:hypothetical protein